MKSLKSAKHIKRSLSERSPLSPEEEDQLYKDIENAIKQGDNSIRYYNHNFKVPNYSTQIVLTTPDLNTNTPLSRSLYNQLGKKSVIKYVEGKKYHIKSFDERVETIRELTQTPTYIKDYYTPAYRIIWWDSEDKYYQHY